MRSPMPNVLVVSYYTMDSAYEDGALTRLAPSLDALGLAYELRGIRDRGTWMQNGSYKADFLRDMAAKHPARVLLWVDADAEVCRLPYFLADFRADIGVCIINWARRPYSPMRGRELLAGTIAIRPGQRTTAFLDEWVTCLDREGRDRFNDQEILTGILPEWHKHGAIVPAMLPESYCTIYDLMADEPAPVVLHHQQSREAAAH